MEHEYENIHLSCTPVVVQLYSPVSHLGIINQFVPSKVNAPPGSEDVLIGSAGGGVPFLDWERFTRATEKARYCA